MASVVAGAFRDLVVAGLPEGWAELIDPPRGGGPEHRETSRALLLGDRAAREWAATAIAKKRPGARNHLEELVQLGKPEDAYHQLQPAARVQQQAAASPEERAVVDAVAVLAQELPGIDTEANAAGNRAAFGSIGRTAGEVLLRASALLGGHDFIVEQTNETLRDLVALSGWQNQLGPRFE